MKVISVKMDEEQLALVDELALQIAKEDEYRLHRRAGRIARGTAVRILLEEAIIARKKTQQGKLSL